MIKVGFRSWTCLTYLVCDNTIISSIGRKCTNKNNPASEKTSGVFLQTVQWA